MQLSSVWCVIASIRNRKCILKNVSRSTYTNVIHFDIRNVKFQVFVAPALCTTVSSLFTQKHLHRRSNNHKGKANIHHRCTNSAEDCYESSCCCSAVHDVEKKEKRKHVNLLLDTEGDENERGRRETGSEID